MEQELKYKLKRYFKNASKFLWGLSRANQKDTYPWLRAKGKKFWGEDFDFQDKPYKEVEKQLLENPGIERIIKDLVYDRITNELFAIKAIDFLRDCWFKGKIPDIEALNNYNIKDPSPFLQVNSQFNYVERWEEFAGLWFEEIEPWINKGGTNDT